MIITIAVTIMMVIMMTVPIIMILLLIVIIVNDTNGINTHDRNIFFYIYINDENDEMGMMMITSVSTTKQKLTGDL